MLPRAHSAAYRYRNVFTAADEHWYPYPRRSMDDNRPMMIPDPPTSRPGDEGAIRAPQEPISAEPRSRDRIDEMSESSFPASDPPAVWTWDRNR